MNFLWIKTFDSKDRFLNHGLIFKFRQWMWFSSQSDMQNQFY